MQVKISDLILENFVESRNFLAEFFGVEPTDFEALAPFVKLHAALRALPPEAYPEVAQPILSGMFEEFGLNPTKKADRDKAAQCVDIFALGIQDAINMAVQAQQHNNAAQQALAAGQGRLLRG